MRKPKASPLRLVLAQNLRAERARRGLSQEELAAEANVSRVYVSSIERGTFACSVDVLHRLAEALDLDAPRLLTAVVPSRREG